MAFKIVNFHGLKGFVGLRFGLIGLTLLMFLVQLCVFKHLMGR
jgi:hypothetical protein